MVTPLKSCAFWASKMSMSGSSAWQCPYRWQNMTTINRLLILYLIAALTAACATSPTGRRQLMLVSEESSIVSSKEAYLSTVSELDKAGKLEQDPAINWRVKNITGRLVTEAIKMRPDTANWEWSVVVIDDPEIVNAWCMAGGRMAIYTGLLEQVKPTDDELAQIMGHELAHALAKLESEMARYYSPDAEHPVYPLHN